MIEDVHLKPVIWIGSTRRDFRAMPTAVKSDLGYALYVAHSMSRNEMHRNAKPLRGVGSAASWRSWSSIAATRSIASIRFALRARSTYCLQKKSKRRRETPKVDKALIEQRLRKAERIAEAEHAR
jgi:phage-related protein